MEAPNSGKTMTEKELSGKKRPKLEEIDPDEAFPLIENLPKKKLPLVKDVIGLIRYRKKALKGSKTEKEIITKVSEEVRWHWIHHNVYPLARTQVRRNVEKLFQDYVNVLKSRTVYQKEAWEDRFRRISCNRNNLFDIFCEDAKIRAKQEKEQGIKMLKSDYEFLDAMRTHRKAESVPDSGWIKKKKAAAENEEKKRKRQFSDTQYVTEFTDEMNEVEESEDENAREDFNVRFTDEDFMNLPDKRTRLTEIKEEDPLPRELRHIRTGVAGMTVRDKIYEAIGVLDGYGFSQRNIEIAITTVGNVLFGRNWKMSNETKNGGDLLDTMPSPAAVSKMMKNIQVGTLKLAAQRVSEAKTDGAVISFATDSTTRKGVGKFAPNGLHINKEEYIPLLTLPIASETRENNAEAVVTSFDLLAVGSSCSKEDLYRNVDVHLTDSTAHNHGVTEIVAHKLDREVPAGELFCTTHTVLGFDNAMTKVIKKLEENLDAHKLSQNFLVDISIDNKDTVVTSAISWTMSLFGPEKSHKPWNVYERFKTFMTRKNRKVCLVPLKDYRFGCLSMCSAVFLHHYEDFKEFLTEFSDVTNKLACLVRDALNLPHLLTVLVVFACFGIHVISPFHSKSIATSTTHSNFQEFCSSLHSSLMTCNIDETFFDLSVPFYNAVSTGTLDSVLSRYNQKSAVSESVMQMSEQFTSECIVLANSIRQALAETLKRQRGGAYDFADTSNETSVFNQLANPLDIDKTPIHNMKMERECGDVDRRLKVKGSHLQNVARGSFLHQTSHLRKMYNTPVFRNIGDEVRQFDGILGKWKARQADIQALMQSRKEEENLRIECRKLEMLEYLKIQGGPFTNATQIEQYMSNPDISEKEKQKRMKKEMFYAKNSCTSLPKHHSVFKVLQAGADGKRRMLTATQFAENLKRLFSKANSNRALSVEDFQAAIQKLKSSQKTI